ncbi:MAG: 16S rRNA (adenine(1518)-N(6)/adenine(1519)-N(6))-dimethyltransferase RsmA [bacterium]|nr:16S rRNA (adenine(1518)-N(6)/adenine(1519)-N(6))-dimethyltransferase RsmA [bacterium]
MDIDEVKVLCIKFGIRPSRDRGQNFVIEPRAIERMVEAAEISPEDSVVEIGPGFGVLTSELAKKARKVVAVEVDTNVIGAAKYMLEEYKNVDLVHADILKMSNERLVELLQTPPNLPSERGGNDSISPPFQGGVRGGPIPYKVVSNLPYSITSKVLRKFTECEPRPTCAVLMVQKEVAERVCAAPGAMSMLSVAVQYYGKPEIIAFVDRDAFYPQPEVDSAILKIHISHNTYHISQEEEKRLFQIVRIGFSSRRKQLQNNLTAGLHISREQAFEALGRVGLPEEVRPQELSVDNWIALAGVL